MAHRYYELTLKVPSYWDEKYKTTDIRLAAVRYSLYQAMQKAGLPFMIEAIKEKEKEVKDEEGGGRCNVLNV